LNTDKLVLLQPTDPNENILPAHLTLFSHLFNKLFFAEVVDTGHFRKTGKY